MIGDDACSTFVALLKSILDIVSSIEKEKNRANAAKKPDVPKIKVGKLSKQHFEKLQKAGAEFKYITVPAEKLSEIEKTVRKMGGSHRLGITTMPCLPFPQASLIFSIWL